MNSNKNNRHSIDEHSDIPQDLQIKALLSTIHTSAPSDNLRQKVLCEAKKHLEQRTILEKILGYIKLYFQKRKLGIKPGRKETRVIYSLVLTGILIGCSSIFISSYFNSQSPSLDNNLTAKNISSTPIKTLEENTTRNFGDPAPKELKEVQKIILRFPNDQKSQTMKTKAIKELLSHNFTITEDTHTADAMLLIQENMITLINSNNTILWSTPLSAINMNSPILDDLFSKIQKL